MMWRELSSYGDGEGGGARWRDGLRRLEGNRRAGGSRLSPADPALHHRRDTCPHNNTQQLRRLNA